MKLVILLLTTAILQVSANSFAQRVTLNFKKAPLTSVFKDIRQQTGYDFFYTDALLVNVAPVDIAVKDAELNKILDLLLNKRGLAYTLENNIIVITQRAAAPVATKPKRQPYLIAGKVVDESNLPIPGVTVKIKNEITQTATDAKGEFGLITDIEKPVLLFTSVGFERVEITVGDRNKPVNVVMKTSISGLDQVQVTAYGTTSKRLNAGDITTITATEIAKNPVNNVLEVLQGRVPGLFVQQVTGQPGGAFNLRLRTSGNLSTQDGQPPLIIVDGVRYPGSTLPLSTNTSYATANFLQGGNGLNYLNPNDVESINVLKDIDATAIYGSSGAYGAIIITTKRAKEGNPALNANIYTGISINGKTADVLSTKDYLMLRREAIANIGGVVGPDDLDLNGTWPEDRDMKWKKEFMGDYAQNTSVNVSYSGGSKNTNYLVSGSLRNHGNIQRHKGASKDGSLRFSLNTGTLDNKFTLGLTGTYFSSINDMVPYDFSQASVISVPNAPPPYNPDGTLNWESIGTNVNSSSTASNANRLYKNTTNNLLANATVTYRPIKKLTLRTIFGYSDLTGKEQIGLPTTTFNPEVLDGSQKTVGIFHHYNTRAITIAPYAEFNTKLGVKGDLSIKLGGEVDNKTTYFDDITGTGFPSDALIADPSAGASVVTDYNLTAYRSIGFYGIIKYVWDNKYILDINTRRDGSTKFGPGKRFGNFGSVAAAWIFSEEKFIKNNLPFISYGKLRGSTGVVGGDGIGDFRYLSTYSVTGGTYAGQVGLSPNSIPNPNLNWERNRSSEIGIELGFFNDRLYAEANYYHNVASNQLVDQPLSIVTGFSGYGLNSDAVIRTNGWEMSLNSTNVKSKSFTWSTRFNISLPKSKLLKIPTQRNQNSNFVVNKPVTGVLVYPYHGVDPATGNYLFDPPKVGTTYLQSDKTEFIDLAPKYYGGFQNSFTYKQLSLDVFFTFTKRTGKSFLGQTVFPFGIFGANASTEWLRRWQKPGDITDIPKVRANLGGFTQQNILQSSTGAYSDATYARLQNLSIRYNFTGSFLEKYHLKGLSVYLQGQNLLTISKFGGLDPENLTAGVIPPLRVFTGGINVSL